MTLSEEPFIIHHVKSEEFKLDGGSMFGIVPKVLWEKTNCPDEKNRIGMTTNCLYVTDGKIKILIETGIGSKDEEKFRDIYAVDGKSIRASLQEIGIKSEDIHYVLLSHLHFDHCGGGVKKESSGNLVPAFPNALYLIQRKELEAALHPNEKTRRSYLPDNFKPLMKTGQLKIIDGRFEVLPGLSLLPIEGHSEGMQCVKLTMGEKTFFYSADLFPLKEHVHLPTIMSYDLYPLRTLKSKKEIISIALREKWIMIFAHDMTIPFGTLEEHHGKIKVQEVLLEQGRVL